MAPVVNCTQLWWGPEFVPSIPVQKPSMVVCPCHPSTGEVRQGNLSVTASQSEWVSSRFAEELCLQQKEKEPEKAAAA